MTPALAVDGLTVRYQAGRRSVTAVDDVTVAVDPGETLGIVGESGCGKTTLARAVVGLAPIAQGTVTVQGEAVDTNSRRDRRRLARSVQLVFQNPDTALDPRMTVEQTLAEALTVTGHRDRHPADLLELVALEPRLGAQLPPRLSGGQRQRVAIARALAAEPAVLIADEITSALDASVQGTVLNLLKDLQIRLGLAVVFIGHNLATVRYMSDRLAVMYLGSVVETGNTEVVLAHPEHPYTRALLAAVPSVGADRRAAAAAPGDPPDPANPPPGCRFHPRCPEGPFVLADRPDCATVDPRLGAPGKRHLAACHYAAAATGPAGATVEAPPAPPAPTGRRAGR